MLDVIEKILPPVECTEGTQTIPMFIIPFQIIYKLISLTAINDETPYCIRETGSGCSEVVDTQKSKSH